MKRQPAKKGKARATQRAVARKKSWNATGGGGITAGKRSPLTRSFTGHWGTPDAEMRWDLPSVRARSRQMAQSPVMTAFRNAFLNNVLGPGGIHFQSKVKTSTALYGDRTDGQPDRQAIDIIESRYREACRAENYLVSRDLTKRQADELKLTTVIFDGECFVRTWKPFENAVGMARQIIDPDLCDIEYNEPVLSDGGQIRMGVRFDKWGARVSYFFLERHPYDYQANPNLTRVRVEVPASEIRHIFVPLRPGQTRGLPLTAPAILSVRQLEAFVDAAVVNARIGAARNIYYTKKFPQGWTPQDGLMKVPGDEGEIADELREGESLELPWGVEPQVLDTRFPNGEIEPFSKTAMRFNSMGLGTSYMTLSNDLSEANFSSLRAGLNEERSMWARWQQLIIDIDSEPDVRDFIRYGLASGFIPLPVGKVRKFMQFEHTGRRWPSVNPLQDAMADDAEIAGLRKSPQQCIRERGGDPEEVLREIAEFRDLAESLNLNGPDTVLANSATGGPNGEAGDPPPADNQPARSRSSIRRVVTAHALAEAINAQ